MRPRPFFTPGKDPVPIVQEAGWARGPVWTATEYLAPTGIRSPDRPTRSQSLYRLRYKGPKISCPSQIPHRAPWDRTRPSTSNEPFQLYPGFSFLKKKIKWNIYTRFLQNVTQQPQNVTDFQPRLSAMSYTKRIYSGRYKAERY